MTGYPQCPLQGIISSLPVHFLLGQGFPEVDRKEITLCSVVAEKIRLKGRPEVQNVIGT